MAQVSDIRNPLQRDGTSQAQRYLPALAPAYVRVDERDVEDFLVFALRFARQVIYYDLDNQKDGTWTPFFGCDTSVLIAAIEKTNPLPVKRAVTAQLEGPDTPESLRHLFVLLNDLARQIDAWKEDLASWSGLKEKTAKLIKANLSTTLGRLAGFEKGAIERLAPQGNFDASRYAGFGTEWNLGDPDAVLADPSLFGAATTQTAQIKTAKKTLAELFTALYNVLLDIIGQAAAFFDESLTDQPDHEPHITLFIAFLKLYLQVRDDANKLTRRHLDFYYNDVLRLKTRAAVPDSVHLFFKLARQKDEYQIDEGTAFDAGKDATGVERIYTLDDDLVANIAQIDSLRTVFVASEQEGAADGGAAVIKNVHAAPVANSEDGVGAEIEDTDKPSWKTLGSAAMPEATLGFAVASRALLLAEGLRIITIELHCNNLPASLLQPALQATNRIDSTTLSKAFALSFSGEKAWIEPEPDAVTVTVKDDAATTRRGVIAITATLDLADDPITAFDAEALGEDYGTSLPLAKVLLRHPEKDENAPFVYHDLKRLALEHITLKTDVDEVRTLIVQNDQFAMDASKPFQPFGFAPIDGSHFYVGSAEAFSKQLTGLDLVIEWDALPATFATHYEGYYDPGVPAIKTETGTIPARPADPPLTSDFTADVSVLQDKAWLPPVAGKALFVEDEGRVDEDRMLSLNAADLAAFKPRKINTVAAWNPGTQNGFVRLTLTPRDFYHGDYVNILTRQALAAGKLPNEMKGAHYIDGTYSVELVDAAGNPLLKAILTSALSTEEDALAAYKNLIGHAVVKAQYKGIKHEGGTFGFELQDDQDTPKSIATHPQTYATEAQADAAVEALISGITSATAQARIQRPLHVAATHGPPDAVREVLLPKEPYTPTIKSFYLNYNASLDSADEDADIEFIHIHPFGYHRVSIPPDAAVAKAKAEDDPSVTKPSLTPQLDDEGTLYLGLKNLEPLQNLSILFQVAESTADTDLKKATVVWSYLAKNAWIAFEDYEITQDTTQGLIASGIVTFSMPKAISSGNTRLPATNSDDEALYWIKAAVAANAGAVSELIDAHTQAARATFSDNGNGPDHLTVPLPAETIGGLVNADAALDGVNQPYASFGGRPAEAGAAFYTRISERLRHKGRALTLFDYERLVLERFPGIYKVKCINHSNHRHDLAPGHVLVAVIPDFTNLKAVDRRAPKVTLDTLDAIKTFLQSVNCPFVRCLPAGDVAGDDTLHVLNPLYEEVEVGFKVKFMPEVTAIGFHLRKLNEAIIRFLSPWAFEEGSEINFGGKVYKSSLLNFVEEQDYVDYVADFSMWHQQSRDDVDEIEAGTPRSILIPATQHALTEITGDYCVVEHALTHDGIGHMTLSRDFEVD